VIAVDPVTVLTHDTEKILTGLRAGLRLKDLSRQYRLSREVIRQIGQQNGVEPHKDDYLAATHVAFVKQVSTTVCHALDQGTVFTTLGLRKRFIDMSPKFVNSAIELGELVPLLGVANPPEKIEFTEDDMHAALRAAADLDPGALLTGPTYDRALKSGDITGPSRVLIIQRLGSWAAACEGAGVPYRGARRTYEGFNADKVRLWLDLYGIDMVAANTPITFASYSTWAKAHHGAPSGSLIKARMLTDTTWNTLRDDLIIRTYQSMPAYWVRES
jgi:hypothetical protein